MGRKGGGGFSTRRAGRKTREKPGSEARPEPKKRTPPFGGVLHLAHGHPEGRAAEPPRTSLARRIIAQVFENVKPSRRKRQRHCSSPAKPPKGRLEHGATMRRRGRRQPTHPGGPAKRGAQPGWNSLALPGAPSGGGGAGGAQGRTPRPTPQQPLYASKRTKYARSKGTGGQRPSKGG